MSKIQPDKTIDLDQVQNILKEHPEMNFWADGVTPWHALGIDASILYLQDLNTNPRGICTIPPLGISGYVCDKTVFVNTVSEKYFASDRAKAAKPLFLRLFCQYSFLFHNIKNKNSRDVFYVISSYCNFDFAQRCAKLFPQRRICCTVVDEGVGVYSDTVTFTVDSKIGFWGRVLRLFNSWLATLIFSKSDGIIYNRLFFQHIDKSVSVNKKIFPYYKTVIDERAKRAAHSFSVDLTQSVLICTGAWKRSEIQDDEDLVVLIKVCNYLHAAGCNLLLKLHPRDNFFQAQAEKLHATIVDTTLTTEIMCAISKPKALIGFSTTSLVTAKLFFDIPAFCVADMLDRSKIGKFYLKETGNFKKVFANQIAFPKRENEIIIN